MNCWLVRRVLVILILTVTLKPDSTFASGPCTLNEGTSESQDVKQVVFNQINIEEKGEMNCKQDYAKYQTPKKSTSKYALATFTLLVTMNSGFGYAMGEILAGVHLDYFCRVGKKPVLAQYMHGVPLCNESTFTIVSDRKKSDTVPSAIQNTLHNSGIYNTSAPVFSDDEISKFVAVFDAQARVAGKSAGMFLSRDRCRQSYVMPIKFKTPKVKAKKSARRETITQEAHAKMVHTLEALAEEKNKVAMHLLELWDESEHIRVMIDYGGKVADERFSNGGKTQPKNKKQMNLGMHCDFGFENTTCQYRFVSCHQLPEEANIKNEENKNEYGSVELQQIGQMQNKAKKKITAAKQSTAKKKVTQMMRCTASRRLFFLVG